MPGQIFLLDEIIKADLSTHMFEHEDGGSADIRSVRHRPYIECTNC